MKIKYESNNVTAFLAVVICDKKWSRIIVRKNYIFTYLYFSGEVGSKITIAVVAAPKRAMSDKTETWPINVAIASNTSTPYTYGCCRSNSRND